jgi:hypothetical protein
MSPDHDAGYLYVASNPMMPGLVKAGRTQTPVNDRLRSLYSTGVPCPFVAECARFFVDCFSAEQIFFSELSNNGIRCEDREFFQIDSIKAINLLEGAYRKQYDQFSQEASSFCAFESHSEECFQKLHALGNDELAKQCVRMLEILPFARREPLKLSYLAYVMAKRDERFAWWFIEKCGVDPELPLKIQGLASLRDYSLTAYEYSIYLKLHSLERRLGNIGCSLRDSAALCYVIDALINGIQFNQEALVEFGTVLLKRGAESARILNVDCFVGSPHREREFRYDFYPRNSNLSCAEVIKNLAKSDQRFSELYKHILN